VARDRAQAFARAASGVVVAVALAIAFHGAPQRVVDTWRRLGDPGQTETQRQLVPGLVHGVSGDALVLARRTIPPTARVAIVVGQSPPVEPNVGAAVSSFFCEWLLPRRCVPVTEADWVVTYHAPSEALPVAGREVGLGADANAVEVRR
jgi:hypothetical protein